VATLAQKQRKFTLLVAQLIQHIYANGHEATMGDAYRDPRVHGEIGEKKSYSHPSSRRSPTVTRHRTTRSGWRST
jgi:hypothetical protein